MVEDQRRSVNELLSLARMPNRFFEYFTGESSIFKNPGKSLSSYLIAKAFDDELIVVPAALVEVVKECEVFNHDPFVVNSIVQKILDEAVKEITLASEAPTAQSMSLINKVQSLIDNLISDHTLIYVKGASEDFTIRRFKQNLYDLQDYLGDLKSENYSAPSTA